MGGRPAHGGGQPGPLLPLLHSYGDLAGALGRDMVTLHTSANFLPFYQSHSIIILNNGLNLEPDHMTYFISIEVGAMLLRIEDQTLIVEIYYPR